MATGNYGIVRPSTASVDDMEMFYNFTENRDVPPSSLIALNPSAHITENIDPTDGALFGGLYTLKLPVSVFNQKGFYTIVIRPKQIKTTIVDCGVLAALPNQKGIVLDSSLIENRFNVNNTLVGYRVEYFEPDGTRTRNLFRIITSSNRSEPVNQNLSNTTQKAIRYRLTDNGSLMFLTLTPSSASSVKPNIIPFIGEPGQEIVITNTFFDPVYMEIEMTEHDLETLAYGIYGNQTKSIADGVYTIYNFENEIYRQYNLYEIKDQFNKPLFEVKEEKDNIDLSKEFSSIASV